MTYVLKVIKSATGFKFRLEGSSVILNDVILVNTNFTQNYIFSVVEGGDVTNGYWETVEGNNSFLNSQFEFIISNPAAQTVENPDGIKASFSFSIDYSSPSFVHGHNINIPASKFTWSDETSYIGSFGGTEDGTYDSFSFSSVTRSVTISRPESLSDIAYSDAPSQISISPLYVGEWISSATASVSYSTPASDDGSYVMFIDNISSSKRTYVENSNDMCCMYSALKNTYNRYNNAKCNNTELAKRYKDDLTQLSNLFSLAYNAVSCAKFEDVSSYVGEAKAIANVSECNCSTASGDLILNVFGESLSQEISGGEGSAEAPDVSITSTSDVISVTEQSDNTFVISITDSELNDLIESLDFLTDLNNQITSANTSIALIATGLAEVNDDVIDVDSFNALSLTNSSSTTISGVLSDMDTAITNASYPLNTISFSFGIKWDNVTAITDTAGWQNVVFPNNSGINDLYTLDAYVNPEYVSATSIEDIAGDSDRVRVGLGNNNINTAIYFPSEYKITSCNISTRRTEYSTSFTYSPIDFTYEYDEYNINANNTYHNFRTHIRSGDGGSIWLSSLLDNWDLYFPSNSIVYFDYHITYTKND